MPNMTLYWISGIRPHLVLETPHKCQKSFGDKRERETRVLGNKLEIGVNPSMFMQDLARRKEEGS